MTETPREQTTPDPRIATIARAIAGAIWNPQPNMSGDVWLAVGRQRKRQAEDAAFAVLETIKKEGIVT